MQTPTNPFEKQLPKYYVLQVLGVVQVQYLYHSKIARVTTTTATSGLAQQISVDDVIPMTWHTDSNLILQLIV